MKISFTGAQSTGKTTLLNAMKSMSIFRDFVFRDEITRSIQKQGLKINEQGDDATQNKIIDSHLLNLKFKNCIMDRCLLDGAVYTNYLFNKGRVGEDTKKRADINLAAYIDDYDYIFYLEPEFEPINDGVRSIDRDFQREIVQGFQSYIKDYKIPVIKLTGSVEERVGQVLKVLGKHMKNNIPTIGIYLEDERAEMPTVAYQGTSACFDLKSIEDVVIPKWGSAMVPNGIRIAVPKGYYLEFATRSGMGIKQNLRVHEGIIDAGYTGDLSVKVFNLSDKDEVIKKGKGCVQVKVVKIPEYNLKQITKKEFEEYKENSIRKDCGFGSSDKSGGGR